MYNRKEDLVVYIHHRHANDPINLADCRDRMNLTVRSFLRNCLCPRQIEA